MRLPNRAGWRRAWLPLALILCLAGHAAAQPAVLVLDGSGSMWDEVAGRTRIALLREAVGGLMAHWPAGRPVGLVAYGHRHARDCTDVGLLRPPAPAPGAVTAALAGMTPRGRTPVADALRLAAEALGDGGGSVIIVTDGVDTCDPDPCGVAQGLARAEPRLVVHTIGFALADPAAVAQLRCMAEATGGQTFAARDAEGLAQALERAAAARQGRRAASPRAEPVPQPRLIVTLRRCAACDPMTGGVRLVLRRGEEEIAVDGEPFGRFFDLRPGDYTVQAVAPLFSRPPVPVTVPEGGGVGRAEIVIDAGWLVGELHSEPSGGPVPAGLDPEWRLASGAAVADGPAFLLPAGAQRLEVRLGNVAGEAAAELAPGDVAVRRIGLRFGVLRLAPAPPGATPPEVTVTAIGRPAGAFGEWRTVPGRRLALAPGRYRVEGAAGGTEVEIDPEREVEVALPGTE